jgi:hypothetical protein
LGFLNRFHNNAQQDWLAPSPEHHQPFLNFGEEMVRIEIRWIGMHGENYDAPKMMEV